MKTKQLIKNIIQYALMILVGIIYIFPVYWIFTKAFNGPTGMMSYPPEMLPKTISFENFQYAEETYMILNMMKNTLFVAFFSVTAATFSSLFVAYGFARMKFRGKNFIFAVLLASMMLPWDITIIPQFIGFTKLKLIDTYLPLILPYCFGFPFYIFLMRQFIMGIPYDLDEAALIDGSGKLGTFFNIIIPLMKPAIATVVVYHFLFAWNDFLNPLVYLNSSSKYLISLGIYSMNNVVLGVDWQAIMAGGAAAVVFPIGVFIIAQKYLIEGVAMSGIKG